jgi:hypothetical protein
MHSLRRVWLLLVVLFIWLASDVWPALADDPIQVGLYVQFEDGSTIAECVTLEGPDATGLDVLGETELDLIIEQGGFMGTAICKIDETGCDYPAEDCFCQCQGNPCQYWTYWYAEGGAWKASQLGAASRAVTDGDMEGWVWGSGQVGPPAALLETDVCASQATNTPGATATAASDATPAPTPVASAPTHAPEKAEARATAPATPVATDAPPRVPPDSGSSPAGPDASPFLWLMLGLAGLGGVLVAAAYFTTRRRT